MDTSTLNTKYLKRLNACKEGIKFVVANGLEGFPLDRLNEVEGDFNGFKDWLLETLETEIEYDSKMRRIKETYPNGNTSLYEYDDNGNMFRSTGYYGVYLYEHDDRENLTKVITPSGDTYLYEYNDKGNKIKETYPDGSTHTYEHDDRGNMVNSVSPHGNSYRYEYNERGDVVKEVSPDGDIYLIEYVYHENGALHKIKENDIVRLWIPEF